ncbi:MAG: Pr6Pr family membrane protein [Treponema sp.]|jgi:hypothetical protein|nr:Pr6Pr family membrane protein [Treponema sp.]
MSSFLAKCSGLPQNKIFAAAFRACAFLFAVWGIIAITGTFKSTFNPVTLLAYTIQSNILTAVFFGILLVKTVRSVPGGGKEPISSKKPYGFFPRLSAFITFAIFVTMLVFWFILAPGMTARSLLALDNLAVHLITPLLMLADYLLFTERGKLKKYDPLRGAIIPYAYLLEAMTIGSTRSVRYDSLGNPSYYPYMFLDIDRFGPRVILTVAAMTLFFLVIAFLWRLLDNKLGQRNR